MIKCQACDESATRHVTEIVGGKPVEYHVCETHVNDLDSLKGAPSPKSAYSPLCDLWQDPEVLKALSDPVARHKMAAYLLPALCVALLDHNAELRLVAAFRMMQHGSDGKSALGALRDAQTDSDERVRKVVEATIKYIESEQQGPWFW